MSNVVLFENKARPEYALVKQEASALTKSLAGGGGFGKRISIKGGVFRLIVDGKEVAAIEERYLDVIIVRAAEHIGRTYYHEAYDDEKSAPPDCWSPDELKPDASATNPQCDNCASCPQNVKGSGNDESRACRFSQRVAAVLANDVEGDVMQISLPATSLFGKEEGDNRPLQAYARFIAANNANIEQFITRLKFDTTAATPKLFFKPMRWLTPEEYEIAKAKGASPDAEKAVTMTVAQADKAQPKLQVAGAPLVKPAKAEVKEAPAPETDDEPPAPAPTVGKKGPKKAAAKAAAPAGDDEPPAPEPTVRKTAEAPVLPQRESISKIAANWDD